MRIINRPGLDPREHLALEELLLGQSGGEEFFFLWRSSPCVVVGKNQNAWQEVDCLQAQKMGIPIYRRISGGGTVFHDQGNVNFTFIRNAPQGSLGFEDFLQPVIGALETLGIPAKRANHSDLLLHGAKISGNAQMQKKGRMLHHGTLLFDSDIGALGKLLFFADKDMDSKAVRSRRSGVTNISEHWRGSMDDFAEGFVSALFPQPLLPYELSADEKDMLEKLVNSRYSTWAWNMGMSPPFARTVCGNWQGNACELDFAVEQGIITRCQDRLGALPFELLQMALGQAYDPKLLTDIFSSHNELVHLFFA